LGNPYPSAIRLDEFVTLNTNIDGALYFWRHINGLNSIPSPFYQYYTYNYEPSDYLTATNLGSTPPGFNRNIAAGQGFFALMLHTTTSTTETVTFNNDMRIDGSGDPYDNSEFFRTGNENDETIPDRNRIWLDFVDSNNSAISILIGYADGATDGYDRLYDGIKLKGLDRLFYSILDEDKLAIQGKENSFDEEDTIPLGYIIPSEGSFTIAINSLDGLFEINNQNIYLEDTETNIIHDLRQSPYTFNSESGTFDSRFILRFTDDTLGLEELDASRDVTIRSFNSTIRTISTNKTIKSFELFDIAGKLIYQNHEVNAMTHDYDGSNLSNGTYIVNIKLNNGQIANKKVIL